MVTPYRSPVTVVTDQPILTFNGEDAHKLTLEVQNLAVKAIQCQGSYHRMRQIIRNADTAIKALDRFSQSI